MDDTTPRLALPMLYAGQAQKELTHNEALLAIDSLLHLAVRGVAGTPPVAPAPGDCWIIAIAATGAWAGREGQIAAWSTGGWRYHLPREGMSAWSIAEQVTRRWQAGAWSQGEISATGLRIGEVQVVGARQPAIAAPTGGLTIDEQARAALDEMLAAMRAHGLISAA